jgi:hypothetical protein
MLVNLSKNIKTRKVCSVLPIENKLAKRIRVIIMNEKHKKLLIFKNNLS